MQQAQGFVSYFENSALADAIRENDLLFPLIESVHVLSICLVVGSILVVDLRLLGFASIRRPDITASHLRACQDVNGKLWWSDRPRRPLSYISHLSRILRCAAFHCEGNHLRQAEADHRQKHRQREGRQVHPEFCAAAAF